MDRWGDWDRVDCFFGEDFADDEQQALNTGVAAARRVEAAVGYREQSCLGGNEPSAATCSRWSLCRPAEPSFTVLPEIASLVSAKIPLA